jgi:crossover junction endodeoxyribonuclease RusA
VELSFTVFGVPQPQGSTWAFIPKGWDRPVITTDNAKMKPWRQQVATMALATMNEHQVQMTPRSIPISIALTFVFQKPQSERKATLHKTTKPDLDKLLRAVLDALTGICYTDDSQVTECRVAKIFGSPARLEVQVNTLAEGVPKTPRIHTLQLFETAQPAGGEIGAPETHDFGRAG